MDGRDGVCGVVGEGVGAVCVGVGGCVGWVGRHGCPLLMCSNIPRSALYATLNTYKFAISTFRIFFKCLKCLISGSLMIPTIYLNVRGAEE
jgi:hypothetical protein